MTVCIAAFAERSKAILMLSDKAVTYSSGLQFDTDARKFLRIGDSGWYALVAGNPTLALKIVYSATKSIGEHPSYPNSVYAMMDCLAESYQNVRDKAVDGVLLRPSLLTRDLLVSRKSDLLPLQDDLVLATHANASKYKTKCSILVCGFDAIGPHIFSVTDPGVSDNYDMTGFHAIGVGASTAISRLLWLEARPQDKLPLALYQAFDAKVNAEIMQGVGYDCDAEVLVKGRKRAANVSGPIIRLIDNVFMSYPNTPFKNEKHPKCPDKWESRLEKFSKRVMNPKIRSRR